MLVTGACSPDVVEGHDAGVDVLGGSDADVADDPTEGAVADGSETPAPKSPMIEAGPGFYGYVGEDVRVRVTASEDATGFTWSAGDGRPLIGPTVAPEITLSWQRADRYRLVVTAENDAGLRRSVQTTVTIVPRPVFVPASSSSVQASADGSLVVSINEDANLMTMVAIIDNRPARYWYRRTCEGPRRVALGSETIAVSCPASDEVALFRPTLPSGRWSEGDWSESQRLRLPWGARPFGVLFDERDDLWVGEQGPGALSRYRLRSDDDEANGFEFVERFEGFDDARGLSRLPGGAIAITRWRSDAEEGWVHRLDPTTKEVSLWRFGYEHVTDSSVSTSGVPSYLEEVAVAPDGELAVIGGLQANVLRGLHLSGEPLTFETTLRAIALRVDPATGTEVPPGRKQFDNRGLTSAVTFSTRGDWVWVAHRGSRAVERLDRFSGAQGGALLDVGFAPSGLAVTADDGLLIVEATWSRALRFYDLTGRGLPVDVGAVPLVDEEPLPPAVLRGAQLFNDSFDPRLARDGYMACAHCHLDGDADRFVWDFTDRGEGLRRTISLLGRGGMAQGPLHWSGNFDELQDFEQDIRGPAAGHGLIDDALLREGRVSEPMGDPKAGLSEDLDGLAAYLTHLDRPLRSPFRNVDGSLSEAAVRGQVVFEREDTGCRACHGGAHFTDSAFVEVGIPRLHDVGTLRESSGRRLFDELPGIDTPTLIGVWHGAPYLHDGSAANVAEVLGGANAEDRHGRTSHLSEIEREDLIAFLLSL